MNAAGLLFMILFAPVSLAMFAGTSLAEWLRPGAVFAWRAAWARVFLWLARRVPGIRLEVSGPIPAAGLVAAKHESLFEAIALVALMPRAAVVLKRELLGLPLWRFLVRRAGAIAVDRAGSAGALRAMLVAARGAAARGQPILLFPEGTRTRPGARPPLRPGVAGLYSLLDVPVVPLALDSGRCWPAAGARPRRGVVRFAFGAPIPPGLARGEFERRLHAAINKEP